MMDAKNRFERVYAQGAVSTMEIWVDRKTGVNYLYHRDGNAGGLTPLFDEAGKVVVTAVSVE